MQIPSNIEIFAIIFSLISVVLAIKKSIHTWTFGIIGLIAYFDIFWETKLYADALLQVFFILLSLIGYFEWKYKSDYNISKSKLYIVSIISFITSVCFFRYLTDNPFPILDSLATTLSIVATYLMIKLNRSCWLYWMAADVVYIILFYKIHLVSSMILYLLFLLMAYNGYKNWKND